MNHPKRGQIYRLKSDAVGKPRMILIISRTEINGGQNVVAIPFTSAQLEKRTELAYCASFYKGEGGLEKDCVAKADEVSSYPKILIDFAKGLVGTLNDEQMERVVEALKWTLALS